MKTIIKTLIMTTVAVAAFGADRHLKFQVEFPFSVGSKVMPAGQYRISEHSGAGVGLYLENAADKTAAFVSLGGRDTVKMSEPARIEFACASDGCRIASVSNLSSGTRFSAWKSKRVGTKMIAVLLTPAGE